MYEVKIADNTDDGKPKCDSCGRLVYAVVNFMDMYCVDCLKEAVAALAPKVLGSTTVYRPRVDCLKEAVAALEAICKLPQAAAWEVDDPEPAK